MKKKSSKIGQLGRLTPEEYAERSRMKDLGRMDAEAYRELHKKSTRNDTKCNISINNVKKY